MDKDKILGVVEVVGLCLVVLGAALWLSPSVRLWASIAMAIGTVALAIGRFMQTPFYMNYLPTDPLDDAPIVSSACVWNGGLGVGHDFHVDATRFLCRHVCGANSLADTICVFCGDRTVHRFSHFSPG